MENKLEQSLMYAPMPMQETREVQRVYRTEDLVSLSASALYSGRDDYSKDNEENLNFYSWLTPGRFGEIDFYLQGDEENHKSFKKRINNGSASGGTISPRGNFSCGS